MRFTTVSKSLVLGLAVLLASTAFAATKGTLHLQSATTINGTELKAGDYKLLWEGTGPSVELSILQGKNVVAKTQAKVVDLETKSANDAAVVHKTDGAADSLTGVRFEGKKFALEISGSSDGMPAASK